MLSPRVQAALASRAVLPSALLLASSLRLLAVLATGALEPPAGRWEHGYEVGAVAVALAEGRGFSDPFLTPTGPTAAVGPALPAAWSLLVRAFGPWSAGAWRGFVLLDVAFSTLLVVAVHQLGRRVGGPVQGGAAALLWALHPVGVLGPTTYQGASGLFALTVVPSVAALVALERRDRDGRSLVRPALVLGSSVGVGLWVEPLFVPCLAAWLAVSLARRRLRLVAAGAVACVSAFLVVAPWLVRNAVVFDEVVFLRSWAGPELLLGAVAGPGEPTPIHLHPTRSPEQLALLRELGEPAYAGVAAAQAAELVTRRPGRWLAGAAWRYGAFWVGRVSWWWPAPEHPVVGGTLSALRGPVHLAPVLLAAWGLWRDRRRHPLAVRVLLVVLLSYPVTYALTHVEARYRLPLEPLLVVAIAALAVRCSGGNRERLRPE